MGTMFASADIATLVADFPAPDPSLDRSSLIRSHSGRRLVHSSIVEQKFQKLLGESTKRIPILEMPRLLGVDDYAYFSDLPDVWYDSLDHSLIPWPETESLTQELDQAANTSLVFFTSFAARKRVKGLFHHVLRKKKNAGEWRTFDDPEMGGTRLLCSESYALGMQDRIKKTLQHVSKKAQKCNLSQEFFEDVIYNVGKDRVGLTNGVLNVWAREIIDNNDNETELQGQLTREGKEVCFVPKSFEIGHATRLEEARQTRRREIVELTRRQKFVMLNREDEQLEEIRSELEALPEFEKIEIIASGQLIILHRALLEKTINELREAARQHANSLWQERNESQPLPDIEDSIALGLANTSREPDLAKSLLSSEQKAAVKAYFDDTVAELDVAERNEFVSAFHERILGPVQLYNKGLSIIHDQTLVEKLDDFATGYLNNEYLPGIFSRLKKDRMLLDKARRKEIEKLQSLLSSDGKVKTVSDTEEAIKKCAKKLKIEPPSPDALKIVRLQTLKKKMKLMRKMAKGSDVLQNLIWILLSQQADLQNVDALFVSSGKDTSRMIKHYQTVGDGGMSEKLSVWRDDLKAGGDGEALRSQIIQLAESVVEKEQGVPPSTDEKVE